MEAANPIDNIKLRVDKLKHDVKELSKRLEGVMISTNSIRKEMADVVAELDAMSVVPKEPSTK